MKVSFQKQSGNASLAISFFWKLTIETKSPDMLTDYFIPELFFDFFFIKKGKIKVVDKTQNRKHALSPQVLKSIFARPLIMTFSTPLILYGARLTSRFAESFWDEIKANSFLAQRWVTNNTDDLITFANQVTTRVRELQAQRFHHPMFSTNLQESDWLVNFSPRHKRRLYKTTFGMSRKDLLNICNVQSFLEQTCDFASQNPRIIQHVNPDVFYDQPHLNRTFKKMTGFSPLEYFEANSILQDNLMSASYNAL